MSIRQRLVMLALTLLPMSLLAADAAHPLYAMRDKVFSSTSADLGLKTRSRDEIWGVVFEWGIGARNVTLVTLKGDITSLYFSTGGGIIGAGEHENVRIASSKLIETISAVRSDLHAVKSFPFATADHVIFYALSDSGKSGSGSIEVADIQQSKHPLYSAGNAAQALISEIHKATPPEDQAPSN